MLLYLRGYAIFLRMCPGSDVRVKGTIASTGHQVKSAFQEYIPFKWSVLLECVLILRVCVSGCVCVCVCVWRWREGCLPLNDCGAIMIMEVMAVLQYSLRENTSLFLTTHVMLHALICTFCMCVLVKSLFLLSLRRPHTCWLPHTNRWEEWQQKVRARKRWIRPLGPQ